MINLYLARHGQTTWNVARRLQGQMDSPLTELGVNQAKALADRVSTIPFDAIYSSTAGRAQVTARIIAQSQKFPIPVQLEAALTEVNLGNWEGLTRSEIEQKWPQEAQHFWHDVGLWNPKTGETFQTARTRLYNFTIQLMTSLLETGKTCNILFVSHGLAIQLLLSAIEGLEISEMNRHAVVHQASLTHLSFEIKEVNALQCHILKRDDRTHLEISNLIQSTGQIV